MTKRVIVKPGDIFCIELDGDRKCYFQNLGEDKEQLYGNVIRVFKKIYNVNDNPTIDAIVSDEIYFHAHTFINLGVKDNTWYKLGKATIFQRVEKLRFKTFFDDEYKIIQWWDIWVPNEPRKRMKSISKELFNECEWGAVFSSDAIKNKIIYGYFRKYLNDIDKEFQEKSDEKGIFNFLNFNKK